MPYVILGAPVDELWNKIEEDFPEVRFITYRDNDNFWNMCQRFDYISLLRPYCLSKLFRELPHLAEYSIFYIDTDVLFTKDFDISSFLFDDIHYLSDTHSYTNGAYFDSKARLEGNPSSPIYQQPEFVLTERFEDYKKRDILNECAQSCGITSELIHSRNGQSGGAQAILKRVDSKYWNSIMEACMFIRLHLKSVNQQFMRGDTPTERENNGFQSWCADMWALQWLLWKRDGADSCRTPKELDFAWSGDPITKLDEMSIYHNAGMVDGVVLRTSEKDEYGKNVKIEAPGFYKGFYENTTPFDDVERLKTIINHPISKQYCTAFYAEAILRTKANFGL